MKNLDLEPNLDSDSIKTCSNPDSVKREHPALQKMKFINCFLLFWVIFCPPESGSNPDPDPQHCSQEISMILAEVPPPLPPRLPSRLTSSSNRPLPASDRSFAGSSDLSASRSQDGAKVLPRAQAGYAKAGRASGGGDTNYDNFAAARTLGKDKVSLKEVPVPCKYLFPLGNLFFHCKVFDIATREGGPC
jgi:hypothetical protein